MERVEKLKRKIVSRLTGEVDIIHFKDAIDNKVAKLSYKDREIVLEERSSGFVMFLRNVKEYVYDQKYVAGNTLEQAVEEAKRIVKNDEYWKGIGG